MTDAPQKTGVTRFAPLAGLTLVAAIFFATGANRYLSLDALKEHRAVLEDFVATNLVAALFIYALAYVATTALSLPGATLMSLLGGFLFGPYVGAGAVIVAATVGAAIIFSAARTAFGNSLRNRAGPFVRKMEDGFARNAFSYLLLLRLIPIFPFFVVNIAPALFNVSLRTFVVATFIGIIPGAFAFASAGNGLGAVLDAGDDVRLTGLLTQPAVLTPIIALSVLAILPIAARALGLVKTASKDIRA